MMGAASGLAAAAVPVTHRTFYGLGERAFDLTSDPKWFVMTPGHREALSNLAYGISCATGVTLLLGEAGTGKTSVLQRALSVLAGPDWRHRVQAVRISHPTLTVDEFLEALAAGFDLPSAGGSKIRLLRELERSLLDGRSNGRTGLLVIDEAQSLPDALLEEVRLLANLEAHGDKLLRIVLAGQPALGARLNDSALAQFKQRVALRCTLPALELSETATYIAHRVSLAGGTPEAVFSRDAVVAIHEASRGIPRVINVLCDNSLLSGFAADRRPIDSEIVRGVCADFDLPAVSSDPAGALRRATVPLERPRRARRVFALPALVARRR